MDKANHAESNPVHHDTNHSTHSPPELPESPESPEWMDEHLECTAIPALSPKFSASSMSSLSGKLQSFQSLPHLLSNKSRSKTPRTKSMPSMLSPSISASLSCSPSPAPPKKVTVSLKIIEIAAKFWNEQVSTQSFKEQLEIGVCIYLDMMVKDATTKEIFKRHFNSKEKISAISLKFINMIGWIIRTLLRNDDDLASLLSNLGETHKRFGVNIEQFAPMLQSCHEAFSHYFPSSYGIKEKYAFDYIFELAAEMMMGESMRTETIFDGSDYLQGLRECLRSAVGQEYLYRYLQQTMCDEMAIYLTSLHKFESQTCDKGRFMIARNILEVSIDAASELAVNISYENRMAVIERMAEYEKKFVSGQQFEIDVHLFDDVTRDIHKLILVNHWAKFVESLTNMNMNNVTISSKFQSENEAEMENENEVEMDNNSQYSE